MPERRAVTVAEHREDLRRALGVTATADDHAFRVTEYGAGLFRFRCSCGESDEDFLTRDYAIDGWREAHGLEPVIDYPQV